MAKGARYTPEFKAKAVRLLAESRSSYSSETNAISAVAKDPGMAPESLRRWRNQSDATVAEETRQSAEDAMAELRRLRAECVCSIESGPCERVESLQMSGRF